MDLATARAIKKKTQWDLRKATGINQSKISLIEHDYIIPSDEEKAAIAGALRVAVNEIQWPGETLKQCHEAAH
jgi:DNA-binding XRE family transcriptional regulator